MKCLILEINFTKKKYPLERKLKEKKLRKALKIILVVKENASDLEKKRRKSLQY